MSQDFYMVIEKDEDGFYVGEVPALKGCYAQGKSIDELLHNIQEVIEMAVEDQEYVIHEFIGVQKVRIEDELANT